MSWDIKRSEKDTFCSDIFLASFSLPKVLITELHFNEAMNIKYQSGKLKKDL